LEKGSSPVANKQSAERRKARHLGTGSSRIQRYSVAARAQPASIVQCHAAAKLLPCWPDFPAKQPKQEFFFGLIVEKKRTPNLHRR